MQKFCVLTIGRTGSTSLMHYLEKFDDIALPSRDTDCVDNELLHPDRMQQYMQHYAPHADGVIEKPQQLLNAFYASHADSAYAGFKSMPNRHPNYAKFITRSDIRFITLVRRDVASTVASFLMAMETGSWRRSGGEQSGKWRFDVKKHGKAALGNLQYVMESYAMLNQVPNAIKLDYESLCDHAFSNAELNQFFGREIKIDNPKPPTSGTQYVENWDEFVAFIKASLPKPAKPVPRPAKEPPPVAARPPLKGAKLSAKQKVVFVCGLPRSGTSVLFKCLKDHPQISGFKDTGAPEDEGQYLQTVYPKGMDHGGPGRFGFDPEAFLDETSALVTADNRKKLMAEWAPYWDLSKPVLLEKTPSNVIRTRFLQAMVPQSHFVMLLRHPLAVSFATQKWSKTTIASLLEHWLVCWERFDLDRKHLNNVSIIKYEDFVLDPQATLDAIYAAIGHALIGQRSIPLQQEVQADINTKYFKQWQEFRGSYANNPAETNYYEHILESRLMRFGYSLNHPETIGQYP